MEELPNSTETMEVVTLSGAGVDVLADLELLRDGILNIALKLGSGVDKSGKQYHWMIDCREMLLTGSYLNAAAREIWGRIKHFQPDFVAGMTLAANPLTIAVMLESRNDNCKVDGLLIRKEAKADGLKKRIEGRKVWPGATIVLLDDIVNSGDTQKHALEALAPLQANVVAVATVVDCERSGSQLLRSRNLPLVALFTLTDLGIALQPARDKGLLKWEWKAGPINRQKNGVVKSTPCIADKTVFVGSDAGFMAALSFDGNEIWRFMVRDSDRGVHSSPLLLGDCVIFGAYDGHLYCVNRNSGELRWEARLGQWIGSSPTSVPDKSLICVGVEFGEAGGALIAVAADTGVIRWRFDTKQYVHGSPFYDEPRQQVIFGSNDFTLYCVDLEGNQRWQFITECEIKAKPVVDGSGRCFFGSFDGFVYAVDARDGKLLWRHRAGTCIYFTPLVVKDMVIVGSDSYRLLAYCRESGNVRWVCTAGGGVRGGAIGIDEKYVAFASRDGFVYLLDIANGHCLDKFQTSDEIMSAPAFGDGRLFISSLDGHLYSFSIGSGITRTIADRVQQPIADGLKLKHFRLMRDAVDIIPLREEIESNAALWHVNTGRQTNVKVQRETNSIALRSADSRKNPGVNINNVHDCITTAHARLFPKLMQLLEDFAVERHAVLQRTLIVRLQPNGKVYPHIDAGEYYAIRDRYHLVISSLGGSWQHIGDEQLVMYEGELWWFDNKAMHDARNDSKGWRTHVIFDLLPVPKATRLKYSDHAWNFQANRVKPGFSHAEVIDAQCDLNAYAQVENQSVCCPPSVEKPKASKGLAVLAGGGCCTPTADSNIHGDLTSLLRRHDINHYSASVKVFAVKRR